MGKYALRATNTEIEQPFRFLRNALQRAPARPGNVGIHTANRPESAGRHVSCLLSSTFVPTIPAHCKGLPVNTHEGANSVRSPTSLIALNNSILKSRVRLSQPEASPFRGQPDPSLNAMSRRCLSDTSNSAETDSQSSLALFLARHRMSNARSSTSFKLSFVRTCPRHARRSEDGCLWTNAATASTAFKVDLS
jgi:hypothetical protein